MAKDYYEIAKPGIIYGNLITLTGGFFIALWNGAGGGGLPYEAGLLLAAAVGLSLVIASGSVFNNCIDRDIDGLMERTKDRALVSGRVGVNDALAYGMLLFGAGFGMLIAFTNMLAAGVAAVGFFFYVFMYTFWTKRRWSFGTVVGSISGAVPPVVGYAAAGGRLDLSAALLFLVLSFWQMAHFFAIGIYRRNEYAAAGIPILPVSYGIPAAKRAIALYAIAFAAAALALGVWLPDGAGVQGFARDGYIAAAALLSAAWFAFSAKGFFARGEAQDARWARGMFALSLAVLVLLFAAMIGGALLASAAA